jgi:hypothetical protein
MDLTRSDIARSWLEAARFGTSMRLEEERLVAGADV